MVNCSVNLWKQLKMPAISNSFNRFLCILLALSASIPAIGRELPRLDDEQLQWLGERVYASECNSRFTCLTSWNEGEAFPSLGIGHFIWYRSGQTEVFEETFPALLNWFHQEGVSLPAWLDGTPAPTSPWLTREQFLAEFDSPLMLELRQFLADTRAQQVAFIANRLPQQLPALLATQSGDARQLLEDRFYTLANGSPPYGIYALIDYLHFKGSGISPAERYRDEGWGLLQVLQSMRSDGLPEFVKAAESMLVRRVTNAPTERNEQRWLNGWTNRVRGYLPPAPSH